MKIEQVEPKGYLKEILDENKKLKSVIFITRLYSFIYKIFSIKCKYKK